MQAKNWQTKIKQEQVLAFKAVLDDIPGQPRGVLVSKGAFQTGAQKVAKASGIDLYQLGPMPKEPLVLHTYSWARMSVNEETLAIECTVFNPRFALSLKVAQHAHPIRLESLQSKMIDEYLLFDKEGAQLGRLGDVVADLVRPMRKFGQSSATRTHTFTAPTYIRQATGDQKLRILELTADISVNPENHPPVPMLPSGFVPFMLHNVQTGDSSTHILNSHDWKS